MAVKEKLAKPAILNRVVETFSNITTTANEMVAPIHDRMPVILSPGCAFFVQRS
jgi:putative SOS response-associated peptidase YedK